FVLILFWAFYASHDHCCLLPFPTRRSSDLAAYFKSSGKDYYAFRYDNGNYDGYFSPEGRPMKKAFLKAPVKFSRISSRYNLNRMHPVLKSVRAHLGTDYAAPYNTEIYATADGVIEQIGRTSGNGNYDKKIGRASRRERCYCR